MEALMAIKADEKFPKLWQWELSNIKGELLASGDECESFGQAFEELTNELAERGLVLASI